MRKRFLLTTLIVMIALFGFYTGSVDNARPDSTASIQLDHAAARLKTPKVKAVNTSDGIKVSWKKVKGAGGYKVFIYNSKGKIVESRDMVSTKRNFLFSRAKVGQAYTFKVQAESKRSKAGNSRFGKKAIYYLKSVASVKTANVTDGIKVSWNGKKTGATKYVIYRKEGSGKYVKIKTVETTSYVDTKALSGKKYRYNIVSAKGKSTVKGTVSAVQFCLKINTLKAVAEVDGINLSWVKAVGAKSYKLYKKNGNTWAFLTEVTGTYFKDTNVRCGSVYSYKIEAVSDNIVSGKSKEVTVKTTANHSWIRQEAGIRHVEAVTHEETETYYTYEKCGTCGQDLGPKGLGYMKPDDEYESYEEYEELAARYGYEHTTLGIGSCAPDWGNGYCTRTYTVVDKEAYDIELKEGCVCAFCGEYKEHDLTSETDEYGNITYTCSDCGYSYTEEAEETEDSSEDDTIVNTQSVEDDTEESEDALLVETEEEIITEEPEDEDVTDQTSETEILSDDDSDIEIETENESEIDVVSESEEENVDIE